MISASQGKGARLPLLVFILASISGLVSPDSSAVYILNEHLQLVTSTSLKWVNMKLSQA